MVGVVHFVFAFFFPNSVLSFACVCSFIDNKKKNKLAEFGYIDRIFCKACGAYSLRDCSLVLDFFLSAVGMVFILWH